jgi:hypothetical protein
MHLATVDGQLLDLARSLTDRASSLRSQAEQLPAVLADTYRRRASELELEAFIAEVQSGIAYDQIHRPTA